MTSFIEKAKDWRRRAMELRATAATTTTDAGQESLLGMASALEHHTTNLEQTAAKFTRARGRAAAVGAFDSFVRAHAALKDGEG